jgi:uridine kinase
MILEGVRSLRAELREYISLGILVNTPREVCLERGISRDMQTGKSKEEVLRLWTDWLDAEDVYFAQGKPQSYANIVVDGTKPFEEQINLHI